jgi:hypothetical protein
MGGLSYRKQALNKNKTRVYNKLTNKGKKTPKSPIFRGKSPLILQSYQKLSTVLQGYPQFPQAELAKKAPKAMSCLKKELK